MLGMRLRIGLVAALVASVSGASQWSAEAATRPPVRAGAGTAAKKVTLKKYDRVFGNVFYMVPDGYQAVQQESGVIMVPKSDLAKGDLGGFLLITTGLPLVEQFKEQIEAGNTSALVGAIVVTLAKLGENGAEIRINKPNLVNNPDKDGYRAYALEAEGFDKNSNQQRFIQCYVFLLPAPQGDRVEVVLRVGFGSHDKLVAVQDGFFKLLPSLAFASAGAPRPARLAPALPTDIAAITPKRAPDVEVSNADNADNEVASASGSEGGNNCRTEYETRTFFGNTSFSSGAIPTTSQYQVPVTVCD